MTKISIILPAYNEEKTIAETIRAFYAAMPSAELGVVNNNSTDSTEAIAREVISELAAKGGVIIEPRKRKGNAVRRAFHDMDADV